MTDRKPVLLKPIVPTRYVYQRLMVCRRCGQFTVLGKSKNCPACGKNGLSAVEKRASLLMRRSMWIERLIVLLLSAAAVVLGQSPLQIGAAATVGLILLVLLWTVQTKMAECEPQRLLKKMIKQQADGLINGLRLDHEAAIRAFHDGNKPLAYEMLREIGLLVHSDRLRLEQILLLQSFVLRKDMDLMLEPLLMDRFNADLAEYIGELAKIKRELIKEKAFRYIMMYESQILKMERGESILVGVAGAAVRRKRYVMLYRHLVLRYARKLPRDRFMRLYAIVQNSPELNWGDLKPEVLGIYNDTGK